jgi:TRAP-type C4-dicarboxylate transport system substrate-binding protein
MQEYLKYQCTQPLWAVQFFWVMNLNAWQSLPDDLKKVIEDKSGEKMVIQACEAYDKMSSAALQAMIRDGGVTSVTLSKVESDKFNQAFAPRYNKWVADMAAKGLPGRAVLDEAIRFRDSILK